VLAEVLSGWQTAATASRLQSCGIRNRRVCKIVTAWSCHARRANATQIVRFTTGGGVVFDLKDLAESSINAALEKAERYRLLNEPEDAESICRDVLAIDADNQLALINLTLSLTDQFDAGIEHRYQEACQLAARLASEYEQEYYAGIISERRAKSIWQRATPGSGGVAYGWLRRAMEAYERAEAIRPKNNDDAILRWNTCARLIMHNGAIKPDEHQSTPLELE